MADRIHVVLAANAAYEPGLEATRASIVRSCSAPDRLVFHVFREVPRLAERLRADFGDYKGSPMAFLRLYLGELLPDVGRVIYTDVDTLWNRDICELWETPTSRTIAWVRDLAGTVCEFRAWCRAKGVDLTGFADKQYSCSGVCVIDLARWRREDVLGRCRDFVRAYGLPKYADQDVLNAVLRNDAEQLPRCWDVLVPDPRNTADGCVLHLTGVGRCFNAPYAGKVIQYLYWQHVMRGTPFEAPFFPLPHVPRWLLRILLPGASVYFVDRVYRYLAFRWYFARRHTRRLTDCRKGEK